MELFNIKELRRARGYTIEYMADMLDIHFNTYRNWEDNPESIPIGKARDICRYLDVPETMSIFFKK